jgi:predicted ATP-dependent endonuclease of OLD family
MNFDFRIKRVKINNYRGIKRAEFDLKKNTVVVGRNNAGKSTIVAAIAAFGSSAKRFRTTDINLDLLDEVFKHRTSVRYLSDHYEELQVIVELEYDWENLPNRLRDFIDSLDTKGFAKVRGRLSLNKNLFTELAQESDAKNFIKYFEKSVEIYDYDQQAWEPAMADNIGLSFPRIGASENNSGQELFYIQASRSLTDGAEGNDSVTGDLFKNRLNSFVQSRPFSKSFRKSVNQIKRNLHPGTDDIKKDLQRFSFGDDVINTLSIIPTIDEWIDRPRVRVAKYMPGMNIELPLSNQGLGYLNLYNILGRIGNVFAEIEATTKQGFNERRSILLVIEEPEVFTHPQLQHVFVQQLLEHISEKSTADVAIQTLIISHSAEVAASAIEKGNNFGLTRIKADESGRVEAQDWTSNEIKGTKRLTSLILNYNAELLFSDKVILVEGAAERIIMNALMRRIDAETGMDLMSQQIAIIPVGNSIKGFEDAIKLLDFRKVVMFTDLDFAHLKGGKKVKVFDYNHASTSTNPTIKEMFLDNDQHSRRFKTVFKQNQLFHVAVHKGLPNFKVYTQGFTSDFLPSTLEPAFLNEANNYQQLSKYFTGSVANKDNNVRLKGNKVEFAFTLAELMNERNPTGQYVIEIPKYLWEGLKWLATR